ncbi:DSHCT (NUC185) domain protein [bacterium BMS3Bbin02]|nr:DSHCT (NUC185) domain protein [bacterium BMS3Bbin02]
MDALWDIVDAVQAAEQRHDLTISREPEVGFAELAHGWVAGAHLEDLFGEAEDVVGDFVRTCRQVLDLLRQIRDGYPELREPARAAIAGMDRGVVAAGGRA